jgi:hypothetical protein
MAIDLGTNQTIDKIEYWKIIPGAQGENWEKCRTGKYINIMWSKLGNISGLSKEEFEKRCQEIIAANSDYNRISLEQIWNFAHIPEGSIIVANEGNSYVLGFGKVTGKYYFVDGDECGHRLPVEWFDIHFRKVEEQQWGGTWMHRLDKEKVDELMKAPIIKSVWWVNQNANFDAEKNGGYIWAPLKGKDGRIVPSWVALRDVNLDDIIVHHRGSKITHVSKVIEPARISRRPEPAEEGMANEEGWFIRLEYHELNIPVAKDKFKEQMSKIKIAGGPLDYKMNARQGYLFPIRFSVLKLIQESQKETIWPEFAVPTSVDLMEILTQRTWIFQANPNRYNLRSAVKALKQIRWGVTFYKNDIRKGDKAYLWESGKNAGILAEAEVVSDPEELPKDDAEKNYIVDENVEEVKNRVILNIISVLSDNKEITREELLNHPILSKMEIIRIPRGTVFKVSDEESDTLDKLFDERISSANIFNDSKPIIEVQPAYTIEEFLQDTGFDKSIIEGWQHRLERKKHIVFQGPPGTGKTFVAQRLAKLVISGTDGFYDLVQFHPSYAYEDFIQGIRPIVVNEKLSYELEDGRFIQFCKRAEQASNSPCVLIIDEINRANLSRVFGELMYLMEYRDLSIPLAGGERFKIPENVLIIGTMNTADRSIALVDHALRRRFSFIRLNPEYDVLKKRLTPYNYPAGSLISVLNEVNKAINDINYEIGISYFVKDGEKLKLNLPEIWVSEIEPYLEEYFYDQPGKVEPFRWNALVKDKLKEWAN